MDGSGARHVFHRHTQLNSSIPIGTTGDVWLSSSLEILTRTDNDHWVLRTPGGLVYELTKLAQYEYLVTTRISDVYGNAWTIAYDPTSIPYFEHPLISSITDDLGRQLHFDYFTPFTMNGQNMKKRLRTVSFGSTPLAPYEYVEDPNRTWAFLWRRTTAEGRVTEYTTDCNSIPAFGTITRITAPTGGATEIGYLLKAFFFAPGNPSLTYAATSIARGGHTWTYDYPGSSQPNVPEFTVTVRADSQVVGTYTYYTYATPNICDPNVWKVGTLIRSSESWNSTRRERTLSYDPFSFSTIPYIPNCSQPPSIPRLTSETVTRDGFSLTTTYSQHDGLNFARQVDSPGSVRRTIAYRHVATAGAYALGTTAEEEVRVNNVQVANTVLHYPSTNALQPDWIDFYRNSADRVHVQLAYYGNANGKKGSLQSKSYGRYHTTYDYQNGVVSSAIFAEGPLINRVVNPNGTVQSETRGGVTISYGWDNDFRLHSIDYPGREADGGRGHQLLADSGHHDPRRAGTTSYL